MKKVRVELRYECDSGEIVEVERVYEGISPAAATMAELMVLPSGIERVHTDARLIGAEEENNAAPAGK